MDVSLSKIWDTDHQYEVDCFEARRRECNESMNERFVSPYTLTKDGRRRRICGSVSYPDD